MTAETERDSVNTIPFEGEEHLGGIPSVQNPGIERVDRSTSNEISIEEISNIDTHRAGLKESYSRVIMIPVGCTPISEKLIHWCFQNAVNKQTDMVVLLNAIESHKSSMLKIFPEYTVDHKLEDENAILGSKTMLQNIGKRYRSEGFMVRARTLVGQTGPEIVKAAHSLHANHVYICSANQHNHKMFGPKCISEYVVKNAECHVTILRPDRL